MVYSSKKRGIHRELRDKDSPFRRPRVVENKKKKLLEKLSFLDMEEELEEYKRKKNGS